MTDRQKPEIMDYVEPTQAEMEARKKRNIAIALCLAGFMLLVFLILLYKYGYFG